MANAAAEFHELAQANASSWRRLLAPIDPAMFLNEYFGEKPLYIPGEPDRFAELFSWNELNAVLEQDILSYPQLHLMRDAKDLDPKLYFTKLEGRKRLDTAATLKEMIEGATLIINNGEVLWPRLREFLRDLERELRAVVHVDVLAGCSPAPALKVHWDQFECFNLQLSGAKLWKLYQPERRYALRKTHAFPLRDDVDNPAAPDAPPVWEGVLRTGDLLYVPRGWWHQVIPDEVPSLHIGIGFEPPTGSDLLHWLADRLRTEEIARRNIPYWKSLAERSSFLRDLREAAASHISCQILDEYLAHLDESAAARPTLALPSSANPQGPDLLPDTEVRFRASRKFFCDVDEQSRMFRFQWKGKTYEFSMMLLSVFQILNGGGSETIQKLSGNVPRVAVQAFLLALWTAGLISIGRPGQTGDRTS
jgi:ribosomal protein L16 Arg81 hydroxylase